MITNFIAGNYKNYYVERKKETKDIDYFRESFDIEIIHLENGDIPLKFIMKSLPVIYHQALRVIMLDEVPSVAIDRIYLYTNGVNVQDPDLALAIGLTPIDFNPDKLEDYNEQLPNKDEPENINTKAGLYFSLDVLYHKNHSSGCCTVYSDDMKWVPLPQQEDFSEIEVIKGIPLQKLLPGEEVDFNGLAVKGYGWDHAKFSPVSLSVGRAKPVLLFREEIKGKDAVQLQKIYQPGVIKIVNDTAQTGDMWKMERLNKNFEDYPNLADKVILAVDETEFTWKIESVRPKNQPAHKIFLSALTIIKLKSRFYATCLTKLNKSKEMDPKDLQDLICGKLRYVEIVGNGADYPYFLFHGENQSFGQSLVTTVLNKYDDNVVCSSKKTDDNTMVICEPTKNLNLSGSEILIEGLRLIYSYFSHVERIFNRRLQPFLDVVMEI